MVKGLKPSVKQGIDWATVKNARGGKTGMPIGGPAIPRSETSQEQGRTRHSRARTSHLDNRLDRLVLFRGFYGCVDGVL